VHAEHVRALTDWFAANARALPWRGQIGALRDSYAVLVSEAMLQQTQVSRVVERFPRFMARFPTVRALAAADERDVLAMWSGMGYYRRAKNLHLAGKMIVERFGGEVPRSVEELRELPGVGRYTAGAIASIAFGETAPIVDGNVARVLLRVHGREAGAGDRAIQGWLWARAEEIAQAGSRGAGAGVVNEALMELGATVCVPAPATPRCGDCPMAGMCIARREGSQSRIPLPKAAAAKQTVYCASVVVRDARGRVLLERRGDEGMWAGLWQVLTIERGDRPPTRGELARAVGMQAAALAGCAGFTHITTHRRVEFRVFTANWPGRMRPRRGEWFEGWEIESIAMSNAQKRVMLLAQPDAECDAGSRGAAARNSRRRLAPERSGHARA